MLRTLEASAQTVKSPPRMLVTHWPVGIVQTGWAPTSGSVGGSAMLKPFADMGLANDMTVLRGVSTAGLASNGGGGHEAGTVKMMTGVACPGTRAGLPEGDDAYSGGPSYDQIFLKSAAALKPPGGGKGYANSIADSRVDFLETSTQCLSYDYTKVPVNGVAGAGMENTPLLPVLPPVQQWMNLFSSFMPGGTGGAGGTTGVNTAMIKALHQRRSILDFCGNELDKLKTLAPAAEAGKIDIHTKAIRDTETMLSNQILAASGTGPGTGPIPGCTKPASPDPNLVGKTYGNTSMNNYGRDATTIEDGPTHALVGKAHLDILKAAMVCDLIRVGTFQWSPGTNHVSFKGMYPGEANTIYMHHPLSHRIVTADTTAAALGPDATFLVNVLTWYYLQHATNMAAWKAQLDGMGNPLLDSTIVPFVTEVQATGHQQNNMAAMLIGGKSLGFTHGTYKTGNWTINQYWGTVGQAFGLGTAAPLGTPIAGIWTQPPA